MREAVLESGIGGLVVDLSIVIVRLQQSKETLKTHFGFCQDQHVGVLCFDVEFESLSAISTAWLQYIQHTFF